MKNYINVLIFEYNLIDAIITEKLLKKEDSFRVNFPNYLNETVEMI